jgi:hypothetical protein
MENTNNKMDTTPKVTGIGGIFFFSAILKKRGIGTKII